MASVQAPLLVSIIRLILVLLSYLGLVDGVAKNTRGQSIYVNLNDRMTQKVLQLARYTTEPVLVLIDVNFPSLPPQVRECHIVNV